MCVYVCLDVLGVSVRGWWSCNTADVLLLTTSLVLSYNLKVQYISQCKRAIPPPKHMLLSRTLL